MRSSRYLSVSILVVVLTSVAGAQTLKVAVEEGAVVLGAGTILSISRLAATNRGLEVTEVSCEDALGARQAAVLRNGYLSILQGTSIAVPGGTIRAWLDLDVNTQGNLGWPIDLEGTPGGNSDDRGLYWNTVYLVGEGGPCLAPEVPAGTVYVDFQAAKINDGEALFALVDIDTDTAAPGVQDAFLLALTDRRGGLLSESIVLRDGDPIPSTGSTMTGQGSRTSSIAFNARGDWMASVILASTGPTDTAILLNGVAIAREGDPAPVPTRTYADMREPEVDLNVFGEYVFSAVLDSSNPNTNELLIKNGQKYLQEGDTFPAIAPHTLTSFGAVPLSLADSGDFFWYGETSNPAPARDTCYFRNLEILVQEGVTSIAGKLVQSLRPSAYAFHVSPSGRFWIGEVVLDLIGETVVFADFGTVIPVPGCEENPATLEKIGGDARVGARLDLELGGAQGPGVRSLVLFSASPAVTGSPCGISLPVGEVLIGLGSGALLGRVNGSPTSGSPVVLQIPIPNDPSLVDQIFWAQGAFWDALGTSGGPTFALSNGLYLEIGAP